MSAEAMPGEAAGYESYEAAAERLRVGTIPLRGVSAPAMEREYPRHRGM